MFFFYSGSPQFVSVKKEKFMKTEVTLLVSLNVNMILIIYFYIQTILTCKVYKQLDF